MDSGLRALATGLELLEAAGKITLTLELQDGWRIDPDAPWHLRDKSKTQATLQVGGRSAVLDVHDSSEVDSSALLAHALYFKRSLRADSVLMPGGGRLRSLGLLSAVHLDGLSRHELRYLLRLGPAQGVKRSPAAALGRVGRWSARVMANRLGAGNRLAVAQMTAAPGPSGPGRVLLMAGLWDPAAVPESCPYKRAEFEQINEMRVQSVRALRAAFGARFTGGIVPTPYAQRRCPDVLLPSMAAASPRQFIAQARQHAVCVTSTGLHGSTGFRLAEFVSLARAIVSEPLRYAVPGPFREDSHYVSYTSPEECVERVDHLLTHETERMQLMRNNAQYYSTWLRPDRLAARIVALLQLGSLDAYCAPVRVVGVR